jgi:hypothetical protein
LINSAKAGTAETKLFYTLVGMIGKTEKDTGIQGYRDTGIKDKG